MNKKLKILIIASWYPNHFQPLNGNFVQNHAKVISKFCDVSLIHISSSSEIKKLDIKVHKDRSYGVFDEYLVYYPKVISNIPLFSGLKKLRLIKNAFKKVLNLYPDLKSCDIVHFHVMLPMILIVDLVKKVINRPIVITEHSTKYTPQDEDNHNSIETWFIRKGIKEAKAITVVSSALKNSLQNLKNTAKIKIIPNVVDISRFCINNNNSTTSKKIILHISDLKDNQKNISGLLQTIAQLKTIREDFILHIVGDGDDGQKLIHLSKKLGIYKNHVRFLGALYETELTDAFQKATFLSLFSNFETFGIVLIEALACGKPVVASRLECIEEFITKKQGVLVTPKNETELLIAFNTMLDNYSDYNPQELSDYAKDNYSYDVIGKQFLALYQSILQK